MSTALAFATSAVFSTASTLSFYIVDEVITSGGPLTTTRESFTDDNLVTLSLLVSSVFAPVKDNGIV